MRVLVVVPMESFFVASGPEFAHAGRRVEANAAAEIRGRCYAFIEDADLGGVANSENGPLNGDCVFQIQRAHGFFSERGVQDMMCH